MTESLWRIIFLVTYNFCSETNLERDERQDEDGELKMKRKAGRIEGVDNKAIRKNRGNKMLDLYIYHI